MASFSAFSTTGDGKLTEKILLNNGKSLWLSK
jgi:hypothetical protein